MQRNKLFRNREGKSLLKRFKNCSKLPRVDGPWVDFNKLKHSCETGVWILGDMKKIINIFECELLF